MLRGGRPAGSSPRLQSRNAAGGHGRDGEQRGEGTQDRTTTVHDRESVPGSMPGRPMNTLKRAAATYIRNTPNRVSGIGAWSAASIPSDRTRRVSSGSMTPSSHSRAVAKYGDPSRS